MTVEDVNSIIPMGVFLILYTDFDFVHDANHSN